MQSTNLPRRWSRTTKQSAIYLASTREFCGILIIARGGRKDMRGLTGRRRNCKQLCGGMEIACRLVFTCSSKAKINRLKELLESKIRR